MRSNAVACAAWFSMAASRFPARLRQPWCVLTRRPEGCNAVEAEERQLDPRLEPALVVLAHLGLPDDPAELELRNVRWGGSHAPNVSSVEVRADGSLYREAQPPARAGVVEEPEDWRPAAFEADVVGHGALVIGQGVSNWTRLSMGSTGTTATAALQGWRWSATTDRAPTLWCARLMFVTSKPPVVLWWPNAGNMLLAVDGSLTRSWRFATDRGPAFVVRNGDDWYLAMDARGEGAPDADLVHLVRSVLGFVLGEPLSLGLFRPVTADGVQPGLVHAGLLGHRDRRATRQPPALPFDCAPTHTAAFVEALLRLSVDAPLLRVIHLYFASLSGFVESNFLHAWVGLEALASWRLKSDRRTDGGPQRLADHKAWLRWVKTHQAEIESLAMPGLEESLVGRVRSSGDGRPTKVQRVFRGLGIQWTAEMDVAEKVRHGVVHEGAIPDDDQDWERDRARVGLVKTMLTALLANIVGYDGPISDRSKTCFDITAKIEPDWWRAEPLKRHLDYRGVGVDEIAAAAQEQLRRFREEHPAPDGEGAGA